MIGIMKKYQIAITVNINRAQKDGETWYGIYSAPFRDGQIDKVTVDGWQPIDYPSAKATVEAYYYLDTYEIYAVSNIPTRCTVYLTIYYQEYSESEKVTVTFDSKGGTDVSPKTVTVNSKLSSIPATTKEGYEFKGWFDSGNIQLTLNTVISKDVTYEAAWEAVESPTPDPDPDPDLEPEPVEPAEPGEAKKVTVTFNSYGGSYVSPVRIEPYNKLDVIPVTTLEGYEFKGWFDSDGNQLTEDTVIIKNITYVADWEIIPVDVPSVDNERISSNAIASCTFTFWNGTKVDFAKTRVLVLPIIYNPVLDETLDTAKIILTDLRAKDYEEYEGVDVTSAFEPNTRVEIKFRGQSTEIVMLVAHDDCKMQRKDNTPWRSYKHEIQLIELTKELERLSVDTLTFTNPVPRIYDSEADADWTITEN